MGHRPSELQLARAGAPRAGESRLGDHDGRDRDRPRAPGCAAAASRASPVPPRPIRRSASRRPAIARRRAPSGDVCSKGACVTALVDPMLDDLPTGTGLFAKLIVVARWSARDRVTTTKCAARSCSRSRRAKGTTHVRRDDPRRQRRRCRSRHVGRARVVAGDGTVHVAYQDALGDELMYTTWNGTPGTPEVVDDGLRAGDRTHPVGAAASIYLVNGAPTIAYQDGMTVGCRRRDQGRRRGRRRRSRRARCSTASRSRRRPGHGSPVLAWDTKDPNCDRRSAR